MSDSVLVLTGGRKRVWRARLAVLVVIVVAAVVVGGLVMRASGSDPVYRTATVGQQSVESMLHGVGTIEPVTQAAVGFPVAGTVAAVDVKVGDSVTAGQPLAALDVTALEATLHQKQAALDQANLTLQNALDGKAASTSATGQSFLARPGQFTVTLYSTTDDVSAAQQSVLSAQQAVDAARAKAATAMTSATNVCGAIEVDPTNPSGAVASINSCQTALQAVMDAQASVGSAQADLVKASSALDNLLAQLAKDASTTTTAPPAPTTTAPPPTTTPPAPTTTAPATNPPTSDTTKPAAPAPSEPPTTTVPGPTTSAPTNASRSGGGGARLGGSGGSSSGTRSSASTSRAPSAADLVADQSAVDSATADVTAAEQAVAQATVVSPIAGTVVAVNLAPGSAVTAGSTTATVLVAGGGGFEAATTVSVDDVTKVKVGQTATVVPDGAATALTGKVVSISAVPATASTSSTSYGVIVSLPQDATLTNGTIGSVGIVTGTGSGLAVPTSAVQSLGAIHTVTLVEGSQTRTVAVQVGVIGDTWTQITSGLTAGQQVLLASVNAPLPSSATSSSNGTTQTPANFPFARLAGRN